LNHIASPSTDDSAIEREIQAKGKTAPRITPADLVANIASVHYFTAGEGVIGAFAAADLRKNEGDAVVPAGAAHPDLLKPALNLLTFCVLVLRNGFTVTGESACASPENFDADIGQKIAYEDAKQKVWPLMGYQLKEQLYQSTQPTHAPE
jgi:hypothetical protein